MATKDDDFGSEASAKSDIPSVLISYSHDSSVHAKSALALADKLRDDGVDADIDQYEQAPSEGWPRWMEQQIRKSQFVILICSEVYYRKWTGEEVPQSGRGVAWEAVLARNELYENKVMSSKFIPVFFGDAESTIVPAPLRGHASYSLAPYDKNEGHTSASLDRADGYRMLYRRLTNQPEIEKPRLGTLKKLPNRDRAIWSGMDAIQDSFQAGDRRVSDANIALFHTSFRRAIMDEKFGGQRMYQIEIVLLGPDDALDQIEKVTYLLDPAYRKNRYELGSEARNTKFKLKELANGFSIVRAEVRLRDHQPALHLNRFINLSESGPRL